MWLEDGDDFIKSCSKPLGTPKSFSATDITQSFMDKNSNRNFSVRHAVSELALNSVQRCGYMLESTRLSRSCSTWVAVGELASTSQLPSPHGYCTSLAMTSMTSSQQQLNSSNSIGLMTATDLIQSVNKKIRETYIRSRLLTAHRAIERLSQSEFNLDQLATLATTPIPIIDAGPTELIVPSQSDIANQEKTSKPQTNNIEIKELEDETSTQTGLITTQISSIPSNISTPPLQKCRSRNLTIDDIEKSRGRPLSKYDRNMMIFNWLHSLDETSTAEEYNN